MKTPDHRIELSKNGRQWLVFDATGGFVKVMPVVAGGDGDDDPATDPPPSDPPAKDPPKDDPPKNDPPKDDPKLSDDEKAELEKLRAENKKNTEELKRARDEAAKHRVGAQDRAKAAARKALEDAGIEIPDDLKDDPDAGTAAAAQHRAAVEAKDAEVRQLKVRDAVRDACESESAKFKLVYGSLIADDKLSTLDPSKDDFEKQVSSLVQATVKADSSLKQGRVPGKSGSDLGGGPTDDKPKSLDEAVGAHYASS